MQLAATSIRRTRLAEKVYARAAELKAQRLEEKQIEMEKEKPAPKPFGYHKGRWVGAECVNLIPEELFGPVASRPLIEIIIAGVCDHYGISRADISSARRPMRFIIPRHVAMYIARENTDKSFPVIGSHFGGRDHTTVLHAVDKVRDRMQTDMAFRNEVELLIERYAGVPKTHHWWGS